MRVPDLSRFDLMLGWRTLGIVTTDLEQKLRCFDGVVAMELSGVLINAWGKGATQPRWNWWLAQLEAALERQPKELIVFSALQIVDGHQAPNIRAQAKREIERLSPSIKQFVIYPCGDGVWATLARSVIRTMFMMSPKTRQFRLVASEPDAVQALYHPGGPSQEQLRTAIRQVMRTVESHAAA